MSYYEPVKLKSDPRYYVIQGTKGGVVPKELKGMFTKEYHANIAIQAYETSQGKGDANKTSVNKRRTRKNPTSDKGAPKGDGQETS